MSSAHACYLHDSALYPCGGKKAPAHTALSLPQITIDYVDRPRDSCRRSSAAAAQQRRRVAPMTRFGLLLPPLRPHPPSGASAAAADVGAAAVTAADAAAALLLSAFIQPLLRFPPPAQTFPYSRPPMPITSVTPPAHSHPAKRSTERLQLSP